jgi:hypothetical protein
MPCAFLAGCKEFCPHLFPNGPGMRSVRHVRASIRPGQVHVSIGTTRWIASCTRDLMRRLQLLALLAPMLAAQSPAVLAGLGTGSYFPLDVGDTWVYRIDTRVVTSVYETWRVDRTVMLYGNTYSVIAIESPGFYYESYFRADSGGRVYLANGNGEQLFLDPSGQSPNAVLQITSRGGASSSLGSFPDAIGYANNMELIQETGSLVRGLGLLNSTAIMLSGSSGGTTEARTLVEATLAGGIRFPAPLSGVELGIESLTLDVSGKNVTNCAVPCYFVACYLAPGADPPGTYKPCARTRVALANWPATASRSVLLQLIAPDGSVPFQSTLGLDASPTESVMFVQVPLYSAPNVPLPSGIYQLTAKSADGAALAALSFQID